MQDMEAGLRAEQQYEHELHEAEKAIRGRSEREKKEAEKAQDEEEGREQKAKKDKQVQLGLSVLIGVLIVAALAWVFHATAKTPEGPGVAAPKMPEGPNRWPSGPSARPPGPPTAPPGPPAAPPTPAAALTRVDTDGGGKCSGGLIAGLGTAGCAVVLAVFHWGAAARRWCTGASSPSFSADTGATQGT